MIYERIALPLSCYNFAYSYSFVAEGMQKGFRNPAVVQQAPSV